MRYVAKPVEVKAFKIVSVDTTLSAREGYVTGGLAIATEDGVNRMATTEMFARYHPVVGDYWVIQEDGYEYLNPKDVFERKYKLIEE